ncbi:cobyrinate a,c-diamide synthase [Lentilactobacillus kosonis]|uniref:Cobyrinate a,c-diamide synthase n=1 Tax=Lentilactobacillus kosonis TaxID=2810561 RepID=A0A401FMR3_9LACO|nr:cobyrinate a,c-diamide synthase [Lentilactobacillus kosonis]GAY73669.1 cobyrinic acid A,C-diamide synthase [Lentilactobacillus kosonis]
MKSIMISGVTSGSGKTSITLGLLKLLSEKMRVQPYKVGPDYVDIKFHSRITGLKSRNLDSFLVPDSQALKWLFSHQTNDVDMGIIEGVMGLYDGLGTDKDAHSSASIAKSLGIPVVLVVDGHAASTSVAAIVRGFIDFDEQVNIAGVIINNLKSEHHFQLIKRAVERYDNIPVLGYLPFSEDIALPSRQLGLVPDNEMPGIDKKIAKIAELMSEHVDLNQLLDLAVDVETNVDDPFKEMKTSLNLGIAMDDAFNFYYDDNLRLLKQVGINLVPFSPIKDRKLPDNVDALYIGGGYPEEFAKELSENHSMRTSIKEFSDSGKSIFAECGGLMYLGSDLTTDDGTYEMVGVIAGKSEMTPRLRKFGYCVARPLQDCLIGDSGMTIRGHEFHHSNFVPDENTSSVLQMSKEIDGETTSKWPGGYQVNNTFASYLHMHFYQNRELFAKFLQNMGAK